MERCRKKREFHIIALLVFLTLLVYWIPAIVSYAESESDSYYVNFKNTEENDISLEIGQQQVLFTSSSDLIDLENLEFSNQVINIHHSFSAEAPDLEILTAKTREFLLSYGYAKLIDLDIATEGEKRNQQYAQEAKLGIWESPSEESDIDESLASDTEDSDTGENAYSEEPDTSESSANNIEDSDTTENTNFVSEKWQVFCSWASEKWQAFYSWVIEEKELIITSILGCGILAFLARTIIHFLRTKRKIVFFGGANSAGKTTMAQYLMNPEASREDLLRKEPSPILSKDRIIRDDNNRKLTLRAVLTDSPGHELQYVIDELSLTLRTRISRFFGKKYAVIILVAPTKHNDVHNEIDRSYINDQLITISKLWSAVFKAKRTVKPQSVTLFINKLDLYDDKEGMISEFSEHKKLLKQICNESKIDFSTIPGSVLDKSGMTELVKKLKK